MKFLLFLLTGLPFFSASQNVKVNVYDKFIKQQRIELEPLTIQSMRDSKVSLSFSSIATTYYLQISGTGWGASTIDVDNSIIFLFSNDSTVTLRSTGLQTFEPGLSQNSYKHQYYISPAEIEAFSRYDLVGIRKYSFKEFTDLSISRETAPKIRSLGALFIRELKKANVLKTLKYISVKDIAKYVGDTVQFCSKVYTSHYYEGADGKPTLLDVRSASTEPLVSTLILGEDRKLFNDAPEKLYTNRDVCMSGTVQIVNGVPQMLIRKRDQIKVKSAITAAEAPLFISDTVTVIGKIFTGKYFPESDNQPTLLNMGAAFPDQPLTIVIESKDRKYFVDQPEVVYLNKTVSVTGQIVLFKNKPQIIIRNSGQIKIISDGASAAAF